MLAAALTAGAASAHGRPLVSGPNTAAAPIAPVQPSIPPQPLRRDQIALLAQVLKDAEADGFRPNEFAPANLDALLTSQDQSERLRGEALLRAGIIRYARAQHGLRITNWPKNWALRPAPYDAEADFNFAVSRDRVQPWLDSLAPPFDRYRLLKAALVKYRDIAAKGGWGSIDPGPELKLGATGPRVVALRRRLQAEEPTLNVDMTSEVFDPALEDALKYYQRRNGFEDTGRVGPITLESLNVPVEGRVLQIIANMERWRWAPRLWPATRVEVNIAAAEMTLFVENTIATEMRAAPGRPDDQTPMLSSQIESVVFNPPWNVPQGIMEKEYLPKEAAHPGYLAAHGFRFIDTPDGGRRLQQKAGAKAALGQIKFDFPNPFAVYLHDTPTRGAFGRDSRAVSHGCVRLEHPIDLANELFKGDQNWTPDHIQDAIDDGKTQRVQLTQAMPVFLMYFTVYPDVRGRMDFRNDIYDWDTQLLRLIDASREPGRRPTTAKPVES